MHCEAITRMSLVCFFSSRRRHTRCSRDWSSDVCSSDLIGHVGSGFDAKKHAELNSKWKELAASTCPFESVPETNEKPSWVKPAVVARVKYSGWTQEKYLRHPVFIGLREDVKPEDCKWESEVAAGPAAVVRAPEVVGRDRKSTRLNSSHGYISYAGFCLKKKKQPPRAPSALPDARGRIPHPPPL